MLTKSRVGFFTTSSQPKSVLGYCYHLVIVIIWLMLSFGYCYHLANVLIWLMLSFCNCYHFVIVIIWLMLLLG
jgi:hypothetical protein